MVAGSYGPRAHISIIGPLVMVLVMAGCALRLHRPSPTAVLGHYHQILDRGPTGGSASGEDVFHDACLALVNVGDTSSVPHLIRALHYFSDIEIQGTKYGIVCTQAHCVAALERITGAKVGVSYSSWKRWWEGTHPGQSLYPSDGLQ